MIVDLLTLEPLFYHRIEPPVRNEVSHIDYSLTTRGDKRAPEELSQRIPPLTHLNNPRRHEVFEYRGRAPGGLKRDDIIAETAFGAHR